MSQPFRRSASRLHPGWLLAGVLLFVAAAGAQDGVVLIDQTCAQFGCFAGDTPGYPVTISAPGSYRLDSNLMVFDPVLSGIVSSVGYRETVTLDLHGFTISGGYQCNSLPPDCPGGRSIGVDGGTGDLEIHGGTIAMFGLYGIRSAGSLSASDLTVSFIGGHGILGSIARLHDLTVGNTRWDAIQILSGVVLDTLVYSARGDGIEITSAGLARGIATTNIFGEGLRLNSFVGYAENELGSGATGGFNLGQNLCGNTLCP